MITALQARSRATEERILAGAESLLADRPFDELSVTAIAREAGVSVGGLYARFENKEALLHALHRRYEERRSRRLGAAFDPARWADHDVAERCRGVITEIVDLFRDERHLLRTFLLRYWSNPEDAGPELKERLEEVYDGGSRILLLDPTELDVDDPEEAARAALGIVMGACRDIVVMKPESLPGHPRLSRPRLIETLTRAALAVMGVNVPGGSR